MLPCALFPLYLFLQLLWEVVREGTGISILQMKKLRLPLKKGVKRETTHKLYLSPPIVVTSWVTNKKLTWIAVLFLYLWLPTPTTQPPLLPPPLTPTCLSLATSHSTRGVASLADEDIWVHIGKGNEHMFSTRNCIQHLICIDWSHSPGKQ